MQVTSTQASGLWVVLKTRVQPDVDRSGNLQLEYNRNNLLWQNVHVISPFSFSVPLSPSLPFALTRETPTRLTERCLSNIRIWLFFEKRRVPRLAQGWEGQGEGLLLNNLRADPPDQVWVQYFDELSGDKARRRVCCSSNITINTEDLVDQLFSQVRQGVLCFPWLHLNTHLRRCP